MLQISHGEIMQVMAHCHEGLCAETLVWVPWNIWQGLNGRWTLDTGIVEQRSVMRDVVIHFTYVQILFCKMLRRRHVKLSKKWFTMLC